jgi:hypothetical protein
MSRPGAVIRFFPNCLLFPDRQARGVGQHCLGAVAVARRGDQEALARNPTDDRFDQARKPLHQRLAAGHTRARSLGEAREIPSSTPKNYRRDTQEALLHHGRERPHYPQR